MTLLYEYSIIEEGWQKNLIPSKIFRLSPEFKSQGSRSGLNIKAQSNSGQVRVLHAPT